MRRRIRLTESDLNRMVTAAVRKAINENESDDYTDYMMGGRDFSALDGENRTAALEHILDDEFDRFKRSLLSRLK